MFINHLLVLILCSFRFNDITNKRLFSYIGTVGKKERADKERFFTFFLEGHSNADQRGGRGQC